jgi:hypothetical protein
MFKDIAERIHKVNFENKVGPSRMRNNPRLAIETETKGREKKKCCN